ncbi:MULTISPECIES: helix-turn-helix domain-containing protein [Priestia]|uniref:Transcriptional regulator, MerR family n=1 Tax=Priestia megaterium (strain ATCC 12872 / QMB1551) TaxID=545693 RepID=D5E3P7_PRIM1|nr:MULTISPECIES: helix-turn-helix domain-containing protein [Priestia]ADE72422.1 transcriptional regulator, MerR family [Priestia megaterium QM B1551]MBG9930616.1 MerR family transcriptional regulator [Priestia aryabhattai]MBG9930681.1 MerR family transcriptional regulator [Priestia aryabhattai]QSX24273.1 MerR family transcriptional regulator [Priestia megaterium]WEZ61463.1 helix-turn-helix domain-containing protein [Priestia megaterium]
MSRRRSLEDILQSEYVSIGELSRLTDSRYSTLKYYTEAGLIPFEQSDENLTRRYPREASVQRIETIKQLKKSGLSISEISDWVVNND